MSVNWLLQYQIYFVGFGIPNSDICQIETRVFLFRIQLFPVVQLFPNHLIFRWYRSVDKIKYLRYCVIYEYEFHRGPSASVRVRRLHEEYGEATVRESTVNFWFQRRRS